MKQKVEIITKKLKTAFFEETDPKIVNEGEIQKYLDKGFNEIKIQGMLIAEYEKNGRNDNLRTYADLQKKNKKKHTKELDMKLRAMLTTLNNQVI